MIVDLDDKAVKKVKSTSILQQTSYWAEVKKHEGMAVQAFYFKVPEDELYPQSMNHRNIVDDVLVYIQPVDRENTIAYVPYGPKIEPPEENQGKFLEELSESVRPYLPNNCLMIRYDLPWESIWARESDYYDYNNHWMGPPDKRKQEFRFNFNTEKWNLVKSYTDILPSNTIFLDLKRKNNELLAGMKSKTRYNIRLSGRKGVQVREAGLEEIGVWYELYSETAKRNGFYLHEVEIFKNVLTTRINHAHSQAVVSLLIAEHGNQPLAAMFLAISGKRATYLFGASSSVKRNYMVPYALQWKAIEVARSKGCTEYDMFGVAPRPEPAHPMYGLYRFKTGFGGDLFHRMGCWDYPFDNEKYTLFKAAEMHSQGYHV